MARRPVTVWTVYLDGKVFSKHDGHGAAAEMAKRLIAEGRGGIAEVSEKSGTQPARLVDTFTGRPPSKPLPPSAWGMSRTRAHTAAPHRHAHGRR